MNPQRIRLLRGELTSAELPDRIDLGEFNATMNELWERSIRDIDQGRVVEWGGVLVLDAAGNLKLINKTAGTADSIDLDVSRISEDETFVGTFHTHPYENGLTGMAFSGADFAHAINRGNILTLVQSGELIFGLIRTEKTPASVDRGELIQELDALVVDCLAEGMFPDEAAFEANLDMCARYGLAFYWGEVFGELQEVYRP